MNKTRIFKTPCKDCKEIEFFSFDGCMKRCPKFLEHLKVVFSKRTSPCKNLQCGVPIISPRKRENCEGCPLPNLFVKILASDGDGVACILGKKRDNQAAPYLRPWECSEGENYYHRR